MKVFEGVKLGVLTVRSRTVVALEVVLQDQLPVCVNGIGLSVSHLGIGQIVGAQRLTNMLKRTQKVRSIRVTVNKHKSHVFDTANGFESMVLGVKVGHDVGFTRGF